MNTLRLLRRPLHSVSASRGLFLGYGLSANARRSTSMFSTCSPRFSKDNDEPFNHNMSGRLDGKN
ncbi:hypothetical protein BG000_003526, partial [Podila horticola]